jgi:hypothetical protein
MLVFVARLLTPLHIALGVFRSVAVVHGPSGHLGDHISGLVKGAESSRVENT